MENLKKTTLNLPALGLFSHMSRTINNTRVSLMLNKWIQCCRMDAHHVQLV